MVDYPRKDHEPNFRSYQNIDLLTFPQHLACITGSSVATALISRPLMNATNLYFLSKPATDMPIPRKNARLLEVIFTNWLKESQYGYGSIPRHTVGCIGTLVIYTNLFREQKLSMIPWSWSGFTAGALTGFGVSLFRHPYEVLSLQAIDPDAPRKFKGPFDVLTTMARHRPDMIFQLYRGFLLSALASTLYYSAFFGVYNLFEYDGIRCGDHRMIFWGWVASAAAETVRYPFHTMKNELRALNEKNKHKAIGYFHLVAKWQKQEGLTLAFKGFFSSHPYLRAWSGAILLYLYSKSTQEYTQTLHGPRFY